MTDRPPTQETATLFTEVPAGRLHVKRWGVHVDPAFDEWFHRTYHGEEKYVIAALAWDAAKAERDRLLTVVRDTLATARDLYARKIENAGYMAVTPGSWQAHMDTLARLDAVVNGHLPERSEGR